MKSINLYTIVIGCLLASGCTIHPVYNIKSVDTTKTQTFTIKDNRPQTEKESEILSSIATSCSYGIARMGDDKTNPDRISYLAAVLSKEKGRVLSDKTITLNHFVIYRNNQIMIRGGLPTGGFTNALLNDAGCYAKKDQPGGYDLEENPDGINAVVIEISLSIDGKKVNSRTVRPAPGTASHFPGTPEVWATEVSEAVDSAVMDIVKQL